MSGATPSTAVAEYWDGDVPWATPRDLAGLVGSTLSDTPRKLTYAGLKSCSAALLPSGSVLFSSRAPIGHVAINSVPMATNQGFKSFVPNEAELDNLYLYWWLRSHKEYLQSLGNGATFKEVSKAAVSRIRIPLPSLPEQRRIAQILDLADALRAKRRAALAALAVLATAVFADVFGDSSSNSKGWPDDLTLADVAEVVSGVTKGRRLNGQSTRTVPYLAVVNVQDRALDLSTVKTIAATDDEIRRLQLKRNDLLLTEGGDPDKLGRGTLWGDELPVAIYQNHIFRVRLTTDLLEPIFLNWLIGSQRGKRYFLKSAKQTTGIASINMTQLRGFPLLVPPRDIQSRFVQLMAAVDARRAGALKSLAQLDALFASLQHRAFRGEL